MKKRNGFVSNSSSSSFIIGIAKVNDIEKCKKYIKDNKLDKNSDLKLSTVKELKDQKSWSITIGKESIEIKSFNGSTVFINIKELKDDDYLLDYFFAGNEGDGAFCNYEDEDDDWCPNYDKVKEADFFDESEQNIIKMFNNPEEAGLDKDQTEWTFGAGRDG